MCVKSKLSLSVVLLSNFWVFPLNWIMCILLPNAFLTINLPSMSTEMIFLYYNLNRMQIFEFIWNLVFNFFDQFKIKNFEKVLKKEKCLKIYKTRRFIRFRTFSRSRKLLILPLLAQSTFFTFQTRREVLLEFTKKFITCKPQLQ